MTRLRVMIGDLTRGTGNHFGASRKGREAILRLRPKEDRSPESEELLPEQTQFAAHDRSAR